jgi:hypothetical protein
VVATTCIISVSHTRTISVHIDYDIRVLGISPERKWCISALYLRNAEVNSRIMQYYLLFLHITNRYYIVTNYQSLGSGMNTKYCGWVHQLIFLWCIPRYFQNLLQWSNKVTTKTIGTSFLHVCEVVTEVRSFGMIVRSYFVVENYS